MQITQFVFGTSMAASYLFVSYTLPNTEKSKLSTAAPAVASAAQAVPWLKQMVFRAGKAATENTQQVAEQVPGVSSQMVTCVDTTGQAFAVWLNVMYLLPLTYLFVRFFVRSYLYRKEPSTQTQTHIHAAEKAGMDALKGVTREIQKAAEMNGEVSEATDDEAVKARAKKTQNHANGNTNGNAFSPVKTRSATANQKKSAANGKAAEQGFAPVSGKKGAKKSSKQKSEPAPGPAVQVQNSFGVLDGKS